MSFLKTTFKSTEYKAIIKYKPNKFNRIELIEDDGGNWFIHSGIKDSELYKPLMKHFNKMENVDTIDFKNGTI